MGVHHTLKVKSHHIRVGVHHTLIVREIAYCPINLQAATIQTLNESVTRTPLLPPPLSPAPTTSLRPRLPSVSLKDGREQYLVQGVVTSREIGLNCIYLVECGVSATHLKSNINKFSHRHIINKRDRTPDLLEFL